MMHDVLPTLQGSVKLTEAIAGVFHFGVVGFEWSKTGTGESRLLFIRGRKRRFGGGSQMDKQRIVGGTKKVTGKIKEKMGRMADHRLTEAEGKAEQAEGHVRSAVGHAKDAARELVDKK